MAYGYAKEIQNRIGAAPDGTIFIVSLNSCLPSPLLLYGMHPIHTGSHGLYV